MPKRVCVVGCGAAGLTSVKACIEQGLEVTAYEQDEAIGGIWYYKKEPKCYPGAAAYKRVVSNSCAERSSFSDFPFPDGTPMFYSHKTALKYLKDYATHFNLWDHIKLNTEVVSVQRTSDYDETGGWKVITREMGSESTTEEKFDAVMIANGPLRKDNVPDVPGISTFPGSISPASLFREGEEYTNKTILIIGNGFTAGDLASEISYFAKKVILALGNGTCVGPTTCAGNISIGCMSTRKTAYLTSRITQNQKLYEIANANVDHINTGLVGEKPLEEVGLMISDSLGHRINCGKVIAKGHLKMISGNKSYFEDGQFPEPVDHIIFAAGYHQDFSIIEEGILSGTEKDYGLYKHMLPVTLKHPTLSFVGMIDIIAAIWPMCELQARWITGVLVGKINLPPKVTMQKEIAKISSHTIKQRKRDSTYYIYYEDELAKDIGCKPNIWKYLFTDPKLAYMYWYGPMFPSQWRLEGPHSCPGSRERYLTGLQRTVTAAKAKAKVNVYRPPKFHMTFPIIVGFIILVLPFIYLFL